MFYDNFSRICAASGTSPFAVTQAMGLSPSTASNWKKNGTIPKQEQLETIARILGCSVADLFSDSSSFRSAVANVHNHIENGTMGDVITSMSTSHINAPMGEMSDDERELLSLYRKLSAIDRAKLMVMADDMASKEG